MQTRRDILAFLGGSAAGFAFTPVPWRLVTDAALWSQDWPGIPKPVRGEVSYKFTNCSLCAAGCAVRARCVGGQPVSLAGVEASPLSRGALCPLGVAGHHAPYHPERLRTGAETEVSAAVKGALAKCKPGERVAVLDMQPGRTASWTYRRAMAALPNGTYIAADSSGHAFDLSKARTVLSLGAPVLDGWGTPGRVWETRAGFRLIQAEAIESRTAALADEWLPLKPGSETDFARGIAAALLKNMKNPPAGAAASVNGFTPSMAAASSGIPEARILALAEELIANGPAAVIPADAADSGLMLNQLAGAFGSTVVARAEAPVPDAWKAAASATSLANVPDGSIRVLLIDESTPGDYIPWGAIEPKLAEDNPVVAVFSWHREGYARHAQFILPTAVYPEVAGDVPAAIDVPCPGFRVSAPLVEPPARMVNPAAFISALAGIESAKALEERAAAIHKSGKGVLITYADGASKPVKELKPEEFWKALNEGACWIDSDARPAPPPARLPEKRSAETPEASGLLPVYYVERFGAAAPASPLTSKLYNESDLRLGPNRAALHPSTASQCGLPQGGRATLQGAHGTGQVSILLDSSIPPGVIAVYAGPELFDLFGARGRARVVAI